jgi:hypothetical protein
LKEERESMDSLAMSMRRGAEEGCTACVRKMARRKEWWETWLLKEE